MGSTLHSVITALDPSLPVYDLKTLEDQLSESLYSDRLLTTLSLALGLLASLLAAVGLYGVMAYQVARRTREIGIRMALGAEREGIAWLVIREALRMTAISLGIGLPIAYAFGRLVESLLFGVKAGDPLVFAISTVFLTAVTLVASGLPALRAAGVKPMAALRYE
jgi:ABC-type antimicrobial peptide transport system permease subunit